jgi:hypothetical protein
VKRSPLKPGKGLKRTGFAKKPRTPLKRTRLAPISANRRDVNTARLAAQIGAWGKKPWVCELRALVGLSIAVDYGPTPLTTSASWAVVPRCHGPVNGHEVLSRARSGSDENLLDVSGQRRLCNGHNGWLTQFPAVPGFVEHSWTRSTREDRPDV